MDPVELKLRQKLLNANNNDIQKIAEEYAKEKKIIDIDDLEMKMKLLRSNMEGTLNALAKEYKLPIEIIKEVYGFSLSYPTLKDFCMDEKARKIYTKKYAHNEEVGGIDVIHAEKEEKKVNEDSIEKEKEPIKE